MSSIVAGLDRRKVLMSGSALATAILLPKVASATAEAAGITQTGADIPDRQGRLAGRPVHDGIQQQSALIFGIPA